MITDSFLKTSVGRRLPPLMHTGMGRSVLAFVLPVVLAGLATFLPDAVPASARVYAVSMRAVRGHAAMYVGVWVAELAPWFQEIAGLTDTYTDERKP